MERDYVNRPQTVITAQTSYFFAGRDFSSAFLDVQKIST